MDGIYDTLFTTLSIECLIFFIDDIHYLFTFFMNNTYDFLFIDLYEWYL